MCWWWVCLSPSHFWERIVTIRQALSWGQLVGAGDWKEGWMDRWMDRLMGSFLLLARLGGPQ